MKSKKTKRNDGITLIALIITIIVLLILAGVSISLVVGDNGVLTQSQQASKKTAIASFLEEANMAYADVYAAKMEDGEFDYEVTLGDVQSKLGTEKIIDKTPTGAEYEITGISVGGSPVSGTVEIPSNGSVELTVTKASSTGTTKYYGIVQGGYYQMKIQNSKIEFIDETPKTLAQVNTEGGGTDAVLSAAVSSGDATIGTVTYDQANGKITIPGAGKNTGLGAGKIKISVTREGETTPDDEEEIDIKMLAYYSVTIGVDTGSSSKGSVGTGSSVTGEYLEGTELTLIGTPSSTDYKLDGWYEKVGTGTETKITLDANNKYTLPAYSGTTAPDARTINVKFKDNTGPYGGIANFGYIDTSTDPERAVANKPKVGGTGGSDLAKNWKYFYNDETNKKIYLIYSYYLENARIPAETNITKDGYTVKSDTGRDALINYLNNTTTWGGFATGVQTAINNKLSGTGSTVTVSNVTATGGPTPELFRDSFNVMNPTVGLNVKNVTSGTNIKEDSESTAINAGADGYVYRTTENDYAFGQNLGLGSLQINSTDGYGLYLPTSSHTHAPGFWLAAPSAGTIQAICLVGWNGYISNANYINNSFGVRPVVSIPYSSSLEASAILTALGLES